MISFHSKVLVIPSTGSIGPKGGKSRQVIQACGLPSANALVSDVEGSLTLSIATLCGAPCLGRSWQGNVVKFHASFGKKYPLVMINIAMEFHPFIVDFPIEHGDFP